MLALTPVPLQTDGERAFFAELVRWDTGGAIRAAVVASIPFTDGQLHRRISDAVLFVPEGLAVVRIAEVSRQSGVVTATSEGAWSIAPQAGPGDVLQISGGGSTPLDGLMRAGMETAVRLRRAGLEPGRIARLTVLVGAVSGMVPEDGDLGEGDQVALLEPRSLLLGLARCSRYSQVDNPRLWTTADVRAALEALGLEGRVPSIEELNGEGFPYSPYVLRRPELLAPAAMATLSPDRPASPVVVPAPMEAGDTPPRREQPSPDAIAGAVAASAAAARVAAAGEPTGRIDQQPRPVTPSSSPPTAVLPAAGAATDTGGLGGLFRSGDDEVPPSGAERPRTALFARPEPPVHTRPADEDDDEEDEDDERASGPRAGLLAALALLLVALVALAGWVVLREPDQPSTAGPTPSDAAGETADPGPRPGDAQDVDGVRYTLEAVQVDDTCVGHSYGETATFFETTDCTGLSRALYSAQLERGPVVVSVARVRMPDTATARDLRALTDRNGSGNVSDLLREGVTYAGAPAKLSSAEYASAVSGPAVTIVESSWVDPSTGGSAADVDRMAANGLALEVPPFPGE